MVGSMSSSILSVWLPPLSLLISPSSCVTLIYCHPLKYLSSSLSSQSHTSLYHLHHARASYRFSSTEEYEEDGAIGCSFDEAVALFNDRDYYKCHDFLESLWNRSQDPTRTLVHGILQYAVGFHHLFNQNHKGAMMELGEGVCKLRKMNLESGPFFQFEKEVSHVLEFIYQTQLEFAACIDDYCLTMDQSETSYKLLGGYGDRQRMYSLEIDAAAAANQNMCYYIVFCPEGFELYNADAGADRPRIKLPTLHATQEQLMAFEYH